ncbi:MAG: hypothetical protein KatS3mg131_0524 [Candidatus Tectimicrobiota bacterium]|nr:MAG: hypothetical protein KatS3mg131_0524 [Candidatus Tectomicrobia bacterium]
MRTWTAVLLLTLLFMLPLLTTGCEDEGPRAFVLGECRLGDPDCRLQ